MSRRRRYGDRAGWNGGRRRYHRDHIRRDFGHVVERPVHLCAERDERQSEFGSGGGRPLVTIDGSGFTAGSTVKFGTVAATGVTDVSARSEIQATAPAGAGIVDVTVTTSGETSTTSSNDQFSYVPSVTSVSPNSGPSGGGTVVTIDGSGFTAVSTVKFATAPAAGVTYVSAIRSLSTAPAVGGVGLVDITVTTAGETSAISTADEFTYMPDVTGVSPSSGPASGGTIVTIAGSGFSNASTVDFGTLPATSVTYDSESQIMATARPERWASWISP